MSGCGQANDAVIVSARTARAIFRQPFADQAIKVGTFAFAYLSSFYEDSDFEVLLSFRPLSDTDVMLEGALKAADVRAFKAVLPENGEPDAQIDGTCKCTGYSRGRVTPDGVMERSEERSDVLQSIMRK